MIKANELRIGNLVMRNNKFDGKPRITKIIGMMVFQAEKEPEEFEPILLTPDVFKKCVTADGFPITTTRLEMAGVQIGVDRYMIQIDDEHIRSIEHLHELQNIHFALMEKELEVKL